MKNIFVLISLLLILFISCQKENKQKENQEEQNITFSFDSTSLKTTALDQTEPQSFYMRYKFNPGETFKYRLTTISERSQSVVTDSTMTEKMNQTIIFIINFKTLGIDKDSVAELQCTFEAQLILKPMQKEKILLTNPVMNLTPLTEYDLQNTNLT
ncbi:MAG: hypothetical protein M5T52_07520 [Ignavibacteriaceae bacterium]|nr:hypothetical protein [Ignavibacteriaceae bacterium]